MADTDRDGGRETGPLPLNATAGDTVIVTIRFDDLDGPPFPIPIATSRMRLQSHPKARELLFSYMTDKQKALYTEFHWFPVKGKDGKKYAIGDGYQVIDWEKQQSLHIWAQDSHNYLALEDSILGQMLLIQTDCVALHNIGCHNQIAPLTMRSVRAMMVARKRMKGQPLKPVPQPPVSPLFGASYRISRLWG